MKGYLLDTSVVSILGPARPDATESFVRWARTNDDRLYVSSITFFEIAQGIAKLTRLGQHDRARRFFEWRDNLSAQFGDRQLPVEQPVADMGGMMSDAAFGLGKHPGSLDILIASTAKFHDLVILTRNLKHFLPLGVDAIDPLVTLPD
jgi:toxin FitB